MFYIGFYKLYIGVYRFYIGVYMFYMVFISFIYVFICFIQVFIGLISSRMQEQIRKKLYLHTDSYGKTTTNAEKLLSFSGHMRVHRLDRPTDRGQTDSQKTDGQTDRQAGILSGNGLLPFCPNWLCAILA